MFVPVPALFSQPFFHACTRKIAVEGFHSDTSHVHPCATCAEVSKTAGGAETFRRSLVFNAQLRSSTATNHKESKTSVLALRVTTLVV